MERIIRDIDHEISTLMEQIKSLKSQIRNLEIEKAAIIRDFTPVSVGDIR